MSIEAFRKAIAETGIKGRFFLTQNDGTLMDAAYAEKFPVLTFASGPTNSMRGAAFLSGVSDAIVVDIGGTTIGCRLAAQGLSAPGDGGGGGRRRAHQFPHARRVLDRPRRRLACRRDRQGHQGRPDLGRLQARHRRADLRRLDADDVGRRRGGRQGRFRRPHKGRAPRRRTSSNARRRRSSQCWRIASSARGCRRSRCR